MFPIVITYHGVPSIGSGERLGNLILRILMIATSVMF